MKEHLKTIGEQLRFVVIYQLADLIIRLAPNSKEGKLWVAGIVDIGLKACDVRGISV